MSKVIFFGYPAQGHTNPTLLLVKELVNRGEEVVYYSEDKFRDQIEATGATYREYKIKISTNITTGSSSSMVTDGFEGMLYVASSIIGIGKLIMMKMLDEIRNEKPNYIIHDSFAHWGKQIAAYLRIPAISSITTLAFNRKIVEMEPEMYMKTVLLMTSEQIYKKYRVKSPCEMLDTMSFYLSTLHGLKDFDVLDAVTSREELNIVYTSKMLQVHAETFDESFKFIGPSIRPSESSVVFPMERLTNQKLIYISLGTIFNNALDFYKKCIAAFENCDMQVVMSVGKNTDIKSFENAPSNFIIRDYVPQLEILKRADVFISHAGFNSVSESLYYAVPLVLFPQSVDQFVVAERVDNLGAGVYMRNEKATPEELRSVTYKVMADHEMKRQCALLSESLHSAGGCKHAVDKILEYTSLCLV